MKVRLGLLTVLCCLSVLLAISPFAVTHSQNKSSAAGDGLSKDEQDLLQEINDARAHPDVYAGYLEKLKPLFKGKLYNNSLTTHEGWAAVEDAITFLRLSKPQGPLSFSTGLRKAAMTHANEQRGSGATGHKGGEGMIEDRVKRFGTWQGGIGENLSYGNDSARERVLTWLIDDGFATRGHRKRMMSADYRVAGLCCGPHPEYGGMCVLTLAGGFTDMIDSKTTTPTSSQPAKSSTGTSTISNTNTKAAPVIKSGSNTNKLAPRKP